MSGMGLDVSDLFSKTGEDFLLERTLSGREGEGLMGVAWSNEVSG